MTGQCVKFHSEAPPCSISVDGGVPPQGWLKELTLPRLSTSQLLFLGARDTWPGRRGSPCKVHKLLILDSSILLTSIALQAQSYACDQHSSNHLGKVRQQSSYVGKRSDG